MFGLGLKPFVIATAVLFVKSEIQQKIYIFDHASVLIEHKFLEKLKVKGELDGAIIELVDGRGADLGSELFHDKLKMLLL